MAEQKIYIGSVGPFLYDDADPIDDSDGDLAGQNHGGIATTGSGYFGGGLIIKPLKLPDIDDSNLLSIYWNEDDTVDRILNILLSGADRSLTLSGDSELNQDLTTLSTPTFADLILSTPTYTMFNLTAPGANSVPQWNIGTSVWEWTTAGGITDLSSFTTDDLTEGITNLYFPGFTDLSTDYGFTDNSSNWDTAYGWGDHSIVGYINDSSFTADSQVLVGTGNGTYAAESGATLRTSLGLGTTDTPQFTGLNLTTGELTTGSINRATGILTLEIAGSPMVSISNTETYFDENLIIKDNAYVGSYSSYDALQILWDGTLKSKYGIDGGTTELTIGSINRASGSLTLEIGGTAEQTISATETTFGGNIVIPDAGYIGSASDTDAIQIESDGDINLSGSNLTINSDLGDVTSKLIFGRTTGGNAEISYQGTQISTNKIFNPNGNSYGDPGTYPNKIVLWQAAENNYFGFGVSIGDLDYFSQVNHKWYVGYTGSPGFEAMVLNGSGQLLINTTSAIGTEKLRVNGAGYFDGTLTADSYTDHTPYYDGDALAEIMKIKGKDGEIDHESLPEFLRTKKIVYKNNQFVEEFTNERNIGNNVSMLNVAVMQLYNEIQSLKSQGVKYV